MLTCLLTLFRLSHSKPSHVEPRSKNSHTQGYGITGDSKVPKASLCRWSCCGLFVLPPNLLLSKMNLLTFGGGVPYGVYAIVQVGFLCMMMERTPNLMQNFNFALKFQPQCFAGLTLITWGQILYYGKWVIAWITVIFFKTNKRQKMVSDEVNHCHNSSCHIFCRL